MSSNLIQVLLSGLVLAGLTVSGCQNPNNPTSALAVDLSLATHKLRASDTLTGTIRLRNKTPWFVTIPFPNVQQTELLFYGADDSLSVVFPGYRQPMESKLELGPFCSKAYPFRFPPKALRTVDSLLSEVYRVRARPADYETPYTEDAVELTE